VWLGWAILAAVMLSYVIRFGPNLPIQDEWWFVPVLFGDGPAWPWIFERHNEHRFVLGRAVYLGLHAVSGHDFRAGMVVSLVLLAGSAALALWSARRLRGRLVPTDFILPALFLNGAHGENLTMGYQVVVTLTTAAVAGLLAVVGSVGSRTSGRSLLAASLLLLAVGLGGAPGVTFGPPLAVWLAYLGWTAWRARDPGTRGPAAVALVTAAVVLSYCSWNLSDVAYHPSEHGKNSPDVIARHTIEFLTVGLGTAGREAWPVFGYLVGTLYAIAIIGLGLVVVRRPAERPVALGLLAVVGGTLASGIAVGWTRTIGMESRYTSLACLGLAAVALASARYGPWRPLFEVRSAVLIAAAIFFLRGNWADGRLYGHVYRHRIQELRRDIDRGVPLDILADRHVIFPVPEYRDNFRLLRDRGFPPFARIADDPPMRRVDHAAPAGGLPPWQDPGPPPKVELPNAGPAHVLAVKIHYRIDYANYWQQFRLTWVAEDRPDAPVQVSETHPWLVPGDGVLAFWIDGPVARMWLSPDSATGGLPITRVSLYLPPGDR
jgi:hypothetical protein